MPSFSVVIADDDSRLVRHKTPEAAVAEARRLATKNPGKRFVVLVGVKAALLPDPIRMETLVDLDDLLPF